MDLLNRYLQAVRKHLPLKRQDDIIAELRANLESQLEDKESELGRPLTQGEAESWLQGLGPPIQVAVQYQPQQYLIGPAIFSLYLYVLRMSFVWATVIYIVISAVMIATSSPSGSAVIGAVVHIPFMLMQVAAWVTLAFAALEFTAAHYPGTIPSLSGLYGQWSPGNLPPVEAGGGGASKPRSYAKAVAEVVLGYLVLGWLLLIPKHPYLLFGPGVFAWDASPFKLAPVWITFFWWILVFNIIQLAWNCIELLVGSWERPRRWPRLVVKALGLAPVVLLASAPGHVYILLKNSATDQGRNGALAESINRGVHVAVLILCAVVAVQLVIEVGQAVAGYWQRREAAR